MAPHLPSGQRSVAMRSFAQVLQPHFRQRPVAFSAAASHSGQALQVASRAARASGGVVVKPELAKCPAAFMAERIISRKRGVSVSDGSVIPIKTRVDLYSIRAPVGRID